MSSRTDTASDRSYTVIGMTRSHCVMSVRREVSEAAGVTNVAVDLGSSRLTVSGEGFSDQAVEAAVADAGYEVAS